MKFIIRLCCFYLLLFGVAFGEEAFSDSIKISEYKLVSEKRIDSTTFEFAYTVKATNISTFRLKKVTSVIGIIKDGFTSIGTGNSKVSIKVVSGSLNFGTLGVGETKESLNTFIIQYDRSIPVNLEDLLWSGEFQKGFILGQDTKGNEITLFLSSPFDSNESVANVVNLIQGNNPTADDFSNLPMITNQFLVIKFAFEGIEAGTFDGFPPLTIEVKYTENPHRLLLLRQERVRWYTFINHEDQNLAEFKAKPENDQIVFALIRRN